MFHLSGAKGHFSALIAFCAAPLILAACGSSPTPTPAPTSTRPPSTPTVAATAAATPVATGTPSAVVSMAAGTSVTVQMQAQSGSGQSGAATLTDIGGTQTKVEVSLSPGPAGATITQPAHIHSGTCAALGDIVYGLNNLSDGTSTTTVNVALSSLMTGKFVVNAHKSDAEITTYTACGTIRSKTASG